jgi:hypothetical protein
MTRLMLYAPLIYFVTFFTNSIFWYMTLFTSSIKATRTNAGTKMIFAVFTKFSTKFFFALSARNFSHILLQENWESVGALPRP